MENQRKEEKDVNESVSTSYVNPTKVPLMSIIRGILIPCTEYMHPNQYNTQNEREFIDNIFDLKMKITSKFGRKIKEYKDIFIVYHFSDLDGHAIKLINGMINKSNMSNTYGCNIRADEAYDIIKKELDNGKQIIIADLSFTREYAEKVDKELDTSRIILLDHHESAMYMNNYDWALVVPHNEENKYLSSGSFMFMIYCFIHFDMNMTYNWDNIMCNIITNVALYDTWFWDSNCDDTREMIKEHFDNNPEDLNMLFKSIKREEFAGYIINNLTMNSSIMTKEDELKIKFMRSETIKTVYRYYHNMRIVEINDKKIGIVFGDNECSAVGNFILRTNRELSYFVMINLNQNNIMLRCRDDYNVATIAISNNGGGHPQAAGFPIDKFDGDELIATMLKEYLEKNNSYTLSINMIKDIAEFDEETKVYNLK